MYGVKSKKIEYLVTPNHRIYCSLIKPISKQKWRFELASEVQGKCRGFESGHLAYLGNVDEPFVLPKVEGRTDNLYPEHGGRLSDNTKNVDPIRMEDWAAFMGWFISEGSVDWYPEDGRYIVHIAQSQSANPEKCAEIEALLSKLPFTCRHNDFTYSTTSKQLATYLKPFGFCHEKYIPEYLFSTSQQSREALLRALML
jgi:hypothetical protein